MRNKYMQRAGVLMAAALMVTMIAPSGSMADDSVVEIRRQDVGQIALDYSPVVKGLELNLMNMSQNYLDYSNNPQIVGLQALYDNLDAYAGLYSFYNAMSPNYQAWLGASAAVASDPTNVTLLGLLADMTDGDYLVIVDDTDSNYGSAADGPDSNTLTGTEEVTLQAEIDTGMMMTVEAYMGYLMMQGQYAMAGITNPNISKSTEYNISRSLFSGL